MQVSIKCFMFIICIQYLISSSVWVLHMLIKKLWKQGWSLELLDDTFESSLPTIEVIQFIRVGLLYVQENSKDMPTTMEVVTMLGSKTCWYLRPNDREKQGLWCREIYRPLGRSHRLLWADRTRVISSSKF